MNTPSPAIPAGTYTCPAHISWVFDDAYTLIVDDSTGRVYRLNGVASAVWAWVAAGQSYNRLITLARATGGDTPNQAAHTVNALLGWWIRQGILCRDEVAADG